MAVERQRRRPFLSHHRRSSASWVLLFPLLLHAAQSFSPSPFPRSGLRSCPTRRSPTRLQMKSLSELDGEEPGKDPGEEEEEEETGLEAAMRAGRIGSPPYAKASKRLTGGKNEAFAFAMASLTSIGVGLALRMGGGKTTMQLQPQQLDAAPTSLVRQVEDQPPPEVYSRPSQVRDPRAAGGSVTDLAEILSPSAIREINQRSEAVRASTRAEVAVVTLPSLSTSTTPKSFATRLFNTWGLGDARRNNGVLVLLVPEQRRVEVEIGRGLNRCFHEDAWLQTMIDTKMRPSFKDGDYSRGVLAGVKEVVLKLEQQQFDDTASYSDPTASDVAIGAGGLGLGFASYLAAADQLSQPVCRRCGKRMTIADGAWDDEEYWAEQRIASRMLTSEDRLEEVR